jgi:Asp-tRNA(Asn)/Glu-tRNA(Gln) amidotransferase A subunit family amidase
LPEYVNANALLATTLKERVENVLQITAKQITEAYALADSCRPVLDSMFGPKLDVILTPSSKGEAPEGLHTTGDAVFNRMWTLMHGPNVGIPVCFGPRGLPVGVTLVGPQMGDARLLAIAQACAPVIDTEPEERKRRLWPD